MGLFQYSSQISVTLFSMLFTPPLVNPIHQQLTRSRMFLFTCYLLLDLSFLAFSFKSYISPTFSQLFHAFLLSCIGHTVPHGSCAKVSFPDLTQAYTTSIAVYSLSIIGDTVPSSITMATSSSRPSSVALGLSSTFA